jgi:hypothetical protein
LKVETDIITSLLLMYVKIFKTDGIVSITLINQSIIKGLPLILPVILRNPASSCLPISPVHNQSSSSNVSLVFSGAFVKSKKNPLLFLSTMSRNITHDVTALDIVLPQRVWSFAFVLTKCLIADLYERCYVMSYISWHRWKK